MRVISKAISVAWLAFAITSLAHAEGTVVLLHGLARSPGSMSKMESALQQVGFTTCNIGYPSTKFPVDELAVQFVVPEIKKCVADGAPVSFVTHSMGGILVREIRRIEPKLEFGRVVMLGPPNRGSELVDLMKGWSLFRWINGPAGQQLGTQADSLPNRLGAADFEVGIIAGNKPFLEPFTRYIDGPSDGKVSVERAKLDGMTAFIALPVTHTLMMRNERVIKQTLSFLKEGHFADAKCQAKNGGPEDGICGE